MVNSGFSPPPCMGKERRWGILDRYVLAVELCEEESKLWIEEQLRAAECVVVADQNDAAGEFRTRAKVANFRRVRSEGGEF